MSFSRICDLPGAVKPNRWVGSRDELHSVESVLRGEEERCSYDDTPDGGQKFARFVLLIENFKRAIGYQNAVYLEAGRQIRAHLPNSEYCDSNILPIIIEYLTGESNPNLTLSEEALERARQFDRRYEQIGKSGDGWAEIIRCYEDLKTMLLENQDGHTVSTAVKTAKNKFALEAISQDESEKAYDRIMREVSAVQAQIKPSYLRNLEENYELVHREIYLAKRIPPANAIIFQASKLGYSTHFEFLEQEEDYVGIDCVRVGRGRGGLKRMPTMNKANSDVTDLTFVDKAQITEKIASISIKIVFDKVKLAREKYEPKAHKPLTAEEQQRVNEILDINTQFPAIRADWEKYIDEDDPNNIPPAVQRALEKLRDWIKTHPETPVSECPKYTPQSYPRWSLQKGWQIPKEDPTVDSLETQNALKASRQWAAVHDLPTFRAIGAGQAKPLYVFRIEGARATMSPKPLEA